MSQIHDDATKMIREQLARRFPHEDTVSATTLDAYAEGLVAVAESYGVPIVGSEGLEFWIEDRYADKDWSLSAWRLWCDRYARLRATVERPQMCPQCYANQLTLTREGVFYCSQCGEVAAA